jgi:hypothetical protein
MGDLLGGIAGAAMGGIMPEMGILSVVAKGLELAEGLLGKKDTQDVGKILDLLTKLVNQSGGGAQASSAAADPQPFDNTLGNSQDGGASAADSGGKNMQVNVTVNHDLGHSTKASPVSHDLLPTVDGSAQGDQNLSNQASQYIEGSDANKSRALAPGSQEWTTVMWAMQQNPNVRYDADSKRFFEKMDDGSKRDLGSLDDAEKVINQNGGFNRNQPTAGGALGDHFNNQVGQADSHPQASSLIEKFADTAAQAGMDPDDINKKIAAMKHKLMAAEDLNKNSSIDIDININESMSVRA